jgi:DNA polymerase-3 subunit delta
MKEEGTSMIGILRMLQGYFYKLRGVHADMKNGTSQDAALMKLRPPLFFKAKPGFIRHLRLWPIKRIDRALSEVLYLESMCKKTGTPEIALIQQRLNALMLARAA